VKSTYTWAQLLYATIYLGVGSKRPSTCRGPGPFAHARHEAGMGTMSVWWLHAQQRIQEGQDDHLSAISTGQGNHWVSPSERLNQQKLRRTMSAIRPALGFQPTPVRQAHLDRPASDHPYRSLPLPGRDFSCGGGAGGISPAAGASRCDDFEEAALRR